MVRQGRKLKLQLKLEKWARKTGSLQSEERSRLAKKKFVSNRNRGKANARVGMIACEVSTGCPAVFNSRSYCSDCFLPDTRQKQRQPQRHQGKKIGNSRRRVKVGVVANISHFLFQLRKNNQQVFLFLFPPAKISCNQVENIMRWENLHELQQQRAATNQGSWLQSSQSFFES